MTKRVSALATRRKDDELTLNELDNGTTSIVIDPMDQLVCRIHNQLTCDDDLGVIN